MNRACSDCQLCCKLVPVKDLEKPALKRCQHQRTGKGCAVYHQPENGFPHSCGLWSCIWLMGENVGRRPDRAHYVVDPMPDFITVLMDGEKITIPVVQIWGDPKFPDCYRDPELLAWLLTRQGFAGIVRFGNERATVIIPPYMNDSGQWAEKKTNLQQEHQHSLDEVMSVLSGGAAARASV